jgi:hypothetical protein
VRKLWIRGIIEALDVPSTYNLDLVVDPRPLRHLEDDVPQRGRIDSPHRQSTREADDSLGEVDLVGLTPKEKCAVAAFDDRDFLNCQEIVHPRFIDEALLLKLVDGEATRAAPGRPMMAAP